jgi:hypothetical protein
MSAPAHALSPGTQRYVNVGLGRRAGPIFLAVIVLTARTF